MTTTTFEIGQRVEHREARNGPRGTITAVLDGGVYVVAWDDGYTFPYSGGRLRFLVRVDA